MSRNQKVATFALFSLLLFQISSPFAQVGQSPDSKPAEKSALVQISALEQLSKDFGVSLETLKKLLNQGYFINDIRKALTISKVNGKPVANVLKDVSPKPINLSKFAVASTMSDPPTTKQNLDERAKQLNSSTMIQTTLTTFDPSPIDLNKVYNQAPYTVPAGDEGLSTLTRSITITQTDLRLPGTNGLDFDLTRSYDSAAAQMYDLDYSKTPATHYTKYDQTNSFLGPGWRWQLPSLEKRNGSVFLHLTAGGTYQSYSLSTGTLVGYAWSDLSLKNTDSTADSGSGGYVLTTIKDGRKYYFRSDENWLKLRILLAMP